MWDTGAAGISWFILTLVLGVVIFFAFETAVLPALLFGGIASLFALILIDGLLKALDSVFPSAQNKRSIIEGHRDSVSEFLCHKERKENAK